MLLVEIIKWLFVVTAIWFSIYLYRSENSKLQKLSKYISDQSVLSSIKRSARKRMSSLLIIFAAFIVWMMSYDFVVKEVSQKNHELSLELEKTSKIYENLTESQIRLITAKDPNKDFTQDIILFYTDVFTNYYVMRKCNLAGEDDIFIINTAMTREMWLNNVSLKKQEQIILKARKEFNKKFINFECNDIHGKYNDIVRNYENYIITTREILRSVY